MSMADLIKKTILLPQEQADARYEVCKACPQYRTDSKKCARCGCYMPVKTRISKASCPLKKW